MISNIFLNKQFNKVIFSVLDSASILVIFKSMIFEALPSIVKKGFVNNDLNQVTNYIITLFVFIYSVFRAVYFIKKLRQDLRQKEKELEMALKRDDIANQIELQKLKAEKLEFDFRELEYQKQKSELQKTA